MELPSRDEPTELEEPGEKPLDFPASAIATELAAVLGRGASTAGAVWRDQPCPYSPADLRVEFVAVVRFVPNHSLGRFLDEATFERFDGELAFMALTTSNPGGDRKTIAVCHCHDLGRFAAASDSNARPPFLAPAWEPSMYASVRSSRPLSRRSCASAVSKRWSTPS
jgi:hypothetical protein